MKDALICCTDAEGSQLERLGKARFDTGWSVDFVHEGGSGARICVRQPGRVGAAIDGSGAIRIEDVRRVRRIRSSPAVRTPLGIVPG